MTAPEDQNGLREALARWFDDYAFQPRRLVDSHLEDRQRVAYHAADKLITGPLASLVADRASLRAAEAEITRLKETVEALGAALKPFADEAETISESSFSHFDDDSLAPSRFEIGELRLAAEALTTLSPKGHPHG